VGDAHPTKMNHLAPRRVYGRNSKIIARNRIFKDALLIWRIKPLTTFIEHELTTVKSYRLKKAVVRIFSPKRRMI
jgi:hypothetical protein